MTGVNARPALRTSIEESAVKGPPPEPQVGDDDYMKFAGGRPLFGRDSEMATLRLAAAAAADGGPVGVVLVGEAGVGKTRLAVELADQLEREGAILTETHGVQLSGGELPYAGVAQMVRGLVRAVGAAELTQAAGRELRALGAFDRAFGEEQVVDRTEIIAALLSLVEGLGRRRTLVWVIDDLQWLDAASRDLTNYLIRVTDEARLLVLITVRESLAGADDGGDAILELARAPGVTTLPVYPLTSAAVDAQARSLSARPLDDSELRRIRRLSDGLPFFVEELVAADGRTPPTLRKAVSMTARELADSTRLLLRAAALEETFAQPELVAQVADLSHADLAAALAEARDHDILRLDRDSEMLRFRHALLREAVADEMLAGERRALHRRWGEALDQVAEATGSRASLLVGRARHWYLTGDSQVAFPRVLEAARYVDAVEDQAARALWWGRVLEAWPANDDVDLSRDRVLYNLLLALLAIGEVQRAADILRHEIALPSVADRMRALWLLLTQRHLARFAGQLDSAPPVPTDADEVFTWLQTVPTDFRANAALHFLLHEWDGTRPDLYLPICDELARRGEADSEMETWYLAMRHRGWWQQAQGDFEGQLATVRTARAVVLAKIPSRRLEAEWDWCWGLEESGRYEEAGLAAERALAQVEEPRVVLLLWTVLVCCAAAAQSALGRWDVARDWIERGQAEVAGHAVGSVQALLARLSGEIAARTGDIDRAEHEWTSVGIEPNDPAAPWAALSLVALAGEIALATGDLERAEKTLADLGEVKHSVGGTDETAQVLLSLSRVADSGADGYMDRVLGVSDRLLPPVGQFRTWSVPSWRNTDAG